jgi:hypothetical protein
MCARDGKRCWVLNTLYLLHDFLEENCIFPDKETCFPETSLHICHRSSMHLQSLETSIIPNES